MVASADPVAIYEFVRDQIATLPPSPTDWRGAERVARWGPRATLRGGAGTPRDKAELLVDLFGRAGFDATVLQGELTLPAEATGRAILFRTIERTFDPAVTEAELDAWLALLGGDPSASPAGPPDLAAVQSRIVASLGDAATLPRAAKPFDWSSLGPVPVVSVVVGGEARLVNPIIPDGEFGTSYTTTAVRAGPATTARSATFSLLVATTDAPDERTTVATGTWPLDELIGRAVHARFVPAGDPLSTVALRIDQLQTFVPTLALRGPDLPSSRLDADTVVGDAVTVRGTIIRTTEDGVVVGTRALLPAGADVDALAARVAAITFEADAQAFPSIRGRARILDASGSPIEGLPGSALSLFEDGLELGFVLEENHPAPPRVVLLFDTSGSIPEQFLGEGAVALGRALTSDLTAQQPGARVRAAAIASGGAASLRDYSADPDVIEEEIRTMYGYGSDFWSASARAAAYDPTVVVLISDGQSGESPEAIGALRPLLAAGPPIVAIGVGEADMDALGSLAAATGGRAFAATDRDAAVAAILGAMGGQDAFPYRLTFEAPIEGPVNRTASLGLRTGSRVAGEATYQVPPANARVAPPRLAGIYLRVESGGEAYVHTIAGPLADDPDPALRVTPQSIEEAHAALFGATMVSVEGSAPTMSVWLDDQLTAKLSLREAFDAARSGGAEAILEGMRTALTIPAVLAELHAPLPQTATADSVTYELQPRFIVYSERPRWDLDVIRSASILPLSRWATIADDAERARRLTTERTARLAAIESAAFESSTVSALEGQPLAPLPPSSVLLPTRPPSRFALAAYNSWQRVVPVDEAIGAFWAIDPETGTLLGILPDGSGGGATSETEGQVKKIGQVAALLAIVAGLLGGGFPAYGFIALQRAILAQILREAAIVAAIGEDEIPTESMDQTLQELTCDLAKAAFASIAHHHSHTAYNVAVADKASKAAGGPYIPCGF